MRFKYHSKVNARRPIRKIICYRKTTSIMCFVATFAIVLLFVSSQQAHIIPGNTYITASGQQKTLDNRIRAPSIISHDQFFYYHVVDSVATTRNETRTLLPSGASISRPVEINAYFHQTNGREDFSKREIEGGFKHLNIAPSSATAFGKDSGHSDQFSETSTNSRSRDNTFGNSIINDDSFLRGHNHGNTIDQVVDNLRVFTGARPRNVSRIESPHYPWGSHAFGPLVAYEATPHGLRWNAYFYEQTIAVVLENQARMVLNCSLLEIIPKHENRAALSALGRVMALVPLNLRQMVTLATYCESAEERLTPKPETKRKLGETGIAPERLFVHASTAIMGILPGTVWCGLGDRASRYHQLGERRELDSCCRVHDHCPVKVRAGDTRYGFTNTGFSTVSHCLCDEAFRMCLENASKFDEVVSVVGNLFFNILGSRCLARPKRRVAPSAPVPAILPPGGRGKQSRQQDIDSLTAEQDDFYTPRLQCALPDSDGGCRMWLKNPKSIPLKLEVVRPPFKFEAP